MRHRPFDSGVFACWMLRRPRSVMRAALPTTVRYACIRVAGDGCCPLAGTVVDHFLSTADHTFGSSSSRHHTFAGSYIVVYLEASTASFDCINSAPNAITNDSPCSWVQVNENVRLQSFQMGFGRAWRVACVQGRGCEGCSLFISRDPLTAHTTQVVCEHFRSERDDAGTLLDSIHSRRLIRSCRL